MRQVWAIALEISPAFVAFSHFWVERQNGELTADASLAPTRVQNTGASQAHDTRATGPSSRASKRSLLSQAGSDSTPRAHGGSRVVWEVRRRGSASGPLPRWEFWGWSARKGHTDVAQHVARQSPTGPMYRRLSPFEGPRRGNPGQPPTARRW